MVSVKRLDMPAGSDLCLAPELGEGTRVFNSVFRKLELKRSREMPRCLLDQLNSELMTAWQGMYLCLYGSRTHLECVGGVDRGQRSGLRQWLLETRNDLSRIWSQNQKHWRKKKEPLGFLSKVS